ncbi:MAG: DNA recombination protein RmuC [Candidatus Thorarchaeota archaeon]
MDFMCLSLVSLVIFVIISTVWGFNQKAAKTEALKQIDKLDFFNKELTETKINLESDLRNSNKNFKILQVQFDEIGNKFSKLSSSYASLETKKEAQEEAQKNNKDFIKISAEQMKITLGSLAKDILKNKSEELSEISKKTISEMLNPFQKSLKDFQEKHNKEQGSLAKELENLKDFNKILNNNVTNLTDAMKGNFKFQGNWSEMLLERLLEFSGLKKDIHFTVQGVSLGLRTEEGKIRRPDYILNLPDNKKIIIDSKSSISYAIDYFTETTEEAKNIAKINYLSSLKNHINDLHKKDYAGIYKLKESPDFVIMFVPHDLAYLMAIENDRRLIEGAYDKKVVITSPALIMPVLKILDNIWRSHTIEESAAHIAQEAGQMLKGFLKFESSLLQIGKKLDEAKKSYDESVKRLNHGRGNLISRAQKIEKLGAKTNKNFSKELTLKNEFIEEEDFLEILEKDQMVSISKTDDE